MPIISKAYNSICHEKSYDAHIGMSDSTGLYAGAMVQNGYEKD